MHLVVISFKNCWQDDHGDWVSSGGFPLQMNSISTLFQTTSVLITKTKPKEGGIPFKKNIRIIHMKNPAGVDLRRKLYVMRYLMYYLKIMISAIKTADVVHTPLPGDLAFLGMILSLVMEKKLIVRYGGSWARNNRNTVVNDIIRFLMRTFAGKKNVMLVSGSGDQQPDKNIHWLFSTAVSRSEIIRYQPELNRGLSIPAKLVFIGRLSPEKGVDVLLHALRILKDKKLQPMPSLVILGDGSESDKLKELSYYLRVDEFITFTGMVNRNVLAEILLKADFCVQATLTEGLSKAWIDAFAFGLPVIVGNVGAAIEAIGRHHERGWIIKAGDAEVLANCIQQILTKKINWPKMRHECRVYAEERTLEDWSTMIGQICANQWDLRLVEGKLTP